MILTFLLAIHLIFHEYMNHFLFSYHLGYFKSGTVCRFGRKKQFES
ncbi:hypothetical protein Lalb_Chr11g0064821 [Lupinus albus]|uniref:Uncharacterized protein n=1 Tax=Lupinus albus TaxID=3870 RepID=A0A6A4PQ86_LUPAL|nr:hypothetical protein Lalb_Chr11g0064821 [Lupinus albus]